MRRAEVDLHDGFLERASRRRLNSWARIVDREHSGDDDPDDVAASPAERVALVDTLMLLALRSEAPHGVEPRLQRSIARVFKRRC